jgi:2-polyprenyl-3-methyl-5-hydroxy-6-metoxy-1,4-benzoquinol methylase
MPQVRRWIWEGLKSAGRQVPGVEHTWHRLQRIWIPEKPQLYIPVSMSREEWNESYEHKKMDYLGELSELLRYSALAGLVQYFFPEGHTNILDLGCGKGLFRHQLRYYPFGYYEGIDISDVAITQAKAAYQHDACTVFHQGDVATYQLSVAKFHVVVFQEILYYLENPKRIVDRYAEALTPGGIILISLFQNWHTKAMAIAQQLAEEYEILDKNTATSDMTGLSWCFYAYRPLNVKEKQRAPPVRILSSF